MKRMTDEERRKKAEGMPKGELVMRYERAYKIIKTARLYWFRYAIKERATSAVYAEAIEELTGKRLEDHIGEYELHNRIENRRRTERNEAMMEHGGPDGPGRGVRPNPKPKTLKIEKETDET